MFRISFTPLPEAKPRRTILSASMVYHFSLLNMLLVINPLVVAIAVPGIALAKNDSHHSTNTQPSKNFKYLLSPPRSPMDAANNSGGNGMPRRVIEDIVITTSTSSPYLIALGLNEVDPVIFITFMIALYVFRRWNDVTRFYRTHLASLGQHSSSSSSPPTSSQMPVLSVPSVTAPLPVATRNNPHLVIVTQPLALIPR